MQRHLILSMCGWKGGGRRLQHWPARCLFANNRKGIHFMETSASEKFPSPAWSPQKRLPSHRLQGVVREALCVPQRMAFVSSTKNCRYVNEPSWDMWCWCCWTFGLWWGKGGDTAPPHACCTNGTQGYSTELTVGYTCIQFYNYYIIFIQVYIQLM